MRCAHCYAGSGPTGTDGAMTAEDWLSVIDQAAGLGTTMVQFIGGEPTLNRDLPRLVEHALGRGVEVEVFSNLVHVSPALWDVFERPGVRLATSYYTDNAAQHEAITQGRDSYARTTANIAEALRRSIPLRVGVIDVEDGQRVAEARRALVDLGVLGEVRVDHLRQVGRGVREQTPSVDQLCGNCTHGTVAISPTGDVWPCVFSRWLPVGNVRQEALAEIITGPRMVETTAALSASFVSRPNMGPCDPRCGPNCSPACNPSCWPTGAGPCGPKGGCQPNYD
ncbi:radical SAM protein [Actinophytocola sp.]|uniref:radical SAM protein n=1 Tax=Actinophytocola sp. TaxID=1872138 RepID=UPI0025C13CDD|nr:radical SAM protein [Actinophytocola sp.]